MSDYKGKMIQCALKDCPRCTETHEDITFKPLTSPTTDFTHWTLCPRTAQPIMMKTEVSVK